MLLLDLLVVGTNFNIEHLRDYSLFIDLDNSQQPIHGHSRRPGSSGGDFQSETLHQIRG